MNMPSSELLSRMTQAAEIRASGLSWATVGERLKCQPDTCISWTRRYPELWKRLFLQAERRFEREVGAETRAVLRSMLRPSEEARVRLGVGKLLLPRRPLRRAAKDRPLSDEERELMAYIAEMKGFSDDDLERANRPPLAACRANGAADPPGAARPE